MSALDTSPNFAHRAFRVLLAAGLVLAETLAPRELVGWQVVPDSSSPQLDSATPPLLESYIFTPVVADGMSADERKDLTRAFMEEASSQLAERINEKDSDFSTVRDCGAVRACEVVSIQIKQESGEFSYEIRSKLFNSPGPTRHPDIADPRTCTINTEEAGSEPLRVCHRRFLKWYADKLISHDKAWHGVNQ